VHWVYITNRFPFISKTLGLAGMRETASNLNCSIVTLKSFLESLELRAREIKLQDTEARSKDILHTISRIYWPQTQIRYSKEMDEINAKQLRSQLFSISSYWYNSSSLTGLCKDVLKSSSLLKQSATSLPNSLKKLKIMRDFLVGEDKLKILTRIEQLKIGVLGFFTKRQGGYGKDREGVGEWRGRVCGSDCVISMEKNTTTKKNMCKMITIKSIGDSRSLGINLANLMKEFNLCGDVNQKADYYMTPSGRLTTRDKSEGNFCITINRDLESIIISELDKMVWDVELAQNQNLRLCIYDARTAIMEKLTILSDSLTSRDWCPNSQVDCNDLMLSRWSLGNLCSTEMMEQTMLKPFPKTRMEFMRGAWKKFEFTHPWDLLKFRSQLSAFINPRAVLLEDNEESFTLSGDEFKKFKEMASGLWTTSDILSQTQEFLTDWAAEVEESTDLLPIMSGLGSNMSNMDELISMFSTVEGSDEEYLFSLDRKLYMPSAPQFFSSLEVMSQLQTNKTLKELWKWTSSQVSVKFKGTLGKIMSILTGIWMYDTDLEGEEESSKWEADSIALTESILEDQDLMQRPLAIIETMIDELETEIQHSDGVVRASLINSLERYLRTRMLKISMLSDESTEQELKDDYIINAVNQLPIYSHLFSDDQHMKIKYFCTQLDLFFLNKVSKKLISNLEYQRIIASTKEVFVTPILRSACSEFIGNQ